MGMFFNPDNSIFQTDSTDAIYVDKTGLLVELNKVICTGRCCIALSHARRFGKTQAAGMIEAYYSCGCASKELFAEFAVAASRDFEKHLNKYNVLHLDIASVMDFHKEDVVSECIRRICGDIKEVFGQEIDYSKDITQILNAVYKITQKKFVIILDEWDCVIRNCSDRADLVHQYLQFLHALFKSTESRRYLALGYITGILPIKKVRDESALNNFREYTMIESDQFTPYFGFTEDEVYELCVKYGMNYDSVKEWYDGYSISGRHMYNPNSVYEAMQRRRLAYYWKNTSSFETINDFITLDMDGLKEDILYMLEGNRVFVETGTFKNDLVSIGTKDEALTALIHLGYLGYDVEKSEAFIPNFEVSLAYRAARITGNW